MVAFFCILILSFSSVAAFAKDDGLAYQAGRQTGKLINRYKNWRSSRLLYKQAEKELKQETKEHTLQKKQINRQLKLDEVNRLKAKRRWIKRWDKVFDGIHIMLRRGSFKITVAAALVGGAAMYFYIREKDKDED